MNKREVKLGLRRIQNLLLRMNDNGLIRSGNVSTEIETLQEAIRLVNEHRTIRQKRIPEVSYGPHGDRLW